MSSYYYFFKPKQKKITNNELNVQNNNTVINNELNIQYKNTSNFFFDETSSTETNESKINNTDKGEQNITLFDKELMLKLIEIKDELKLNTITHFALLLLCLKKNKYKLESDIWFLQNFNEIFKIEIKAQFLSQQKSNIELILHPTQNLTRTQEKYLKLYNDIYDKLKFNI